MSENEFQPAGDPCGQPSAKWRKADAPCQQSYLSGPSFPKFASFCAASWTERSCPVWELNRAAAFPPHSILARVWVKPANCHRLVDRSITSAPSGRSNRNASAGGD